MKFVTCRIALFILLVFGAGCSGEAPKTANETQINHWYIRMMENVYVSFDSVRWYAAQIDSFSGGNRVYEAMSDIGYGVYYRNREFHEQSRQYYREALKKLEGTNADSLKGRAHAGLGNSLRAQGKINEGTDELLTALRIFETAHFTEGIVGTNNNLAQLFQEENDLPRSLKYLHQGLLAAGKKRNRVYLLSLHTLANTYGMSGKIDSARVISSAGLRLADSLKLVSLKSLFYDNIALCLMNTGQFDSSLYFFRQCIAIDSAAKMIKQVADTYCNLGTWAMMQGKTEDAKSYTLRFIQQARSIGYLQGVRNGWQQMSDIHASAGNFREALTARDSLSAVNKKINEQKSQNRILELEAIYESRKKDDRILAQQREISLRNWIVFWIVIAFVLVLLFSFSFFLRFRDRKNRELGEKLREEQEKATRHIFETEQQERLRIARDLHDSIGQKLAVVKMHLSASPENGEKTNPAIGLVDSSISELRSIAHNLVPEELNFGLDKALSGLASQINAAGNIRIDYELRKAADTAMPGKTIEVAVFRMVQEIISNMLRHSKAGEISVLLEIEPQKLRAEIRDNGPGFDIQSLEQSQGLGWKNLRARSALLGGNISIASAASGTTTSIIIPL